MAWRGVSDRVVSCHLFLRLVALTLGGDHCLAVLLSPGGRVCDHCERLSGRAVCGGRHPWDTVGPRTGQQRGSAGGRFSRGVPAPWRACPALRVHLHDCHPVSSAEIESPSFTRVSQGRKVRWMFKTCAVPFVLLHVPTHVSPHTHVVPQKESCQGGGT